MLPGAAVMMERSGRSQPAFFIASWSDEGEYPAAGVVGTYSWSGWPPGHSGSAVIFVEENNSRLNGGGETVYFSGSSGSSPFSSQYLGGTPNRVYAAFVT